jgi:hypothetical protein
VSQACSGASVANHHKWPGQIGLTQQINNIKNSVSQQTLPPTENSYVTFCQICEWYGYPSEKIIVEFEGIHLEEEDGFIDKFVEYDYDTQAAEKRTKHIYKYNAKLVQEFVDSAVKMRNGG